MALVLSRKTGEAIDLSLDGVLLGVIRFGEMDSGRAKVVIEAVPELRVRRSELQDSEDVIARKNEFQVA
jgi:sRNA-binding carbon storage regulator CsrA